MRAAGRSFNAIATTEGQDRLHLREAVNALARATGTECLVAVVTVLMAVQGLYAKLVGLGEVSHVPASTTASTRPPLPRAPLTLLPPCRASEP